MVKVIVKVDNFKVSLENKRVGKENLAWTDIMDMMIQACGALGVSPSEEALLEYFGITLAEEDRV